MVEQRYYLMKTFLKNYTLINNIMRAYITKIELVSIKLLPFSNVYFLPWSKSVPNLETSYYRQLVSASGILRSRSTCSASLWFSDSISSHHWFILNEWGHLQFHHPEVHITWETLQGKYPNGIHIPEYKQQIKRNNTSSLSFLQFPVGFFCNLEIHWEKD